MEHTNRIESLPVSSPAAGARKVLSHRALWLGAAGAAAVGGVMAGVGIAFPVLLFRTPDMGFNAYNGLLDDLNMMSSAGVVLTTASLYGLYVLVGGGWIGRSGVFLAGLAFVALCVLMVDQYLGYPWTRGYFLLQEPAPLVRALYAIASWGEAARYPCARHSRVEVGSIGSLEVSAARDLPARDTADRPSAVLIAETAILR